MVVPAIENQPTALILIGETRVSSIMSISLHVSCPPGGGLEERLLKPPAFGVFEMLGDRSSDRVLLLLRCAGRDALPDGPVLSHDVSKLVTVAKSRHGDQANLEVELPQDLRSGGIAGEGADRGMKLNVRLPKPFVLFGNDRLILVGKRLLFL